MIVLTTAYGRDFTENDSTSIDSRKEITAVGQKTSMTKADGDSAYMQNDYDSAILIYENLLNKGEAAEVYYNLGNSYYKMNNIAKAILNYERALLLQPGNADIRANLEIARAKTIDKIVPVPDIFFVAWIKSLINMFGVDTWAKLGIVLFMFLLVSCFLYFFSKQIIIRKAGFIIGCILLVFILLSNLFAALQKRQLTERNNAIVVIPSVTVRSTPSENGVSLFLLHEGCKVQINDNSMHEWKEISIEDGKVGWIPASAIEKI